jgi:hypothetical protein
VTKRRFGEVTKRREAGEAAQGAGEAEEAEEEAEERHGEASEGLDKKSIFQSVFVLAHD